MTKWEDTALARYYAALDAGEMETAAEQFALDATYMRLRPGDNKLHAVHGRSEIRRMFDERGKRAEAHEILVSAESGDLTFVQGLLRHPKEAGALVFLAQARIDADGLIRRYVALRSEAGASELEAYEAAEA